jgi:DNA polymerase-3 subunit chi|tara:strand:+ start:57 stop:518 length:462 start_codon:yes stop_codon:yes gene_type:complete
VTRIDFYQIDSEEEPLLFTCRLIDKIYHLGHHIHIHTSTVAQSEQLDNLLWSFRPDRFIPHLICAHDDEAKVDQGAKEPGVRVKISHGVEPDHCDILVNLSNDIPGFFSRFERVAEVVPLDELSRESARISYKFYQDRGYPLHYHEMKANNGE